MATRHPRGTRSRGRLVVAVGVVAVGALALVAGSCGGDEDDATSATRPSTTTSSTTTATDQEASDAWQQDAQRYRGEDGTTHELACPAGGTADTVWGAGVYTDDSSICTAAVQSGLLTFDEGGDVTYEIGPGQDSFDGGTANGVTSQPYGRWEGSFTFPDAPPGSVEIAAGPESWSRTLSEQRGSVGTRVTVVCSADGRPGSVWGSGPYTDDSSVCTAAVHAGVITLADGGTVVAQVAAGQDSYAGSTANGVTTSDYGSFGGSFTFPADQTPG